MKAVIEWWQSLASAPPPLTRRQRLVVWIAGAVVGITRFVALAGSPWDLDEALFMLAVRDYDVAAHHPHPPGFPLFIALAKVVQFFVEDEFRALQSVVLLGAVAVFPAMFLLGRELRFPFAVVFPAALLLAMFPSVVLYGGSALSDVPSMTLVVLSCALLLRGCRDSRSYLCGAVVLAAAAGFRPQNLMIGLAPALAASSWQWQRSRRGVFVALAVGVVLLAVMFGFAIAETGWQRYFETVRGHQRYIRAIDSFLNPARRPLVRLFDDFFIRPVRNPVISIVTTILVLVSIVTRFRRPAGGILLALAAFAPFCLFAWLFLDVLSAGRFSLGYLPLLILLAAEGLHALTGRFSSVLAFLLSVALFVWFWPGLSEVRRPMSPPVAAVDWIRARADPDRSLIYAHHGLLPFVEVLAPDHPVIGVSGDDPPVPWTGSGAAWFLGEGPGDRLFRRARARLWEVSRRRYFDVSVTALHRRVLFGEGWFSEEGRPPLVTRWMSSRSVTRLPAIGGPGRLLLSFSIPSEIPVAVVTIRCDGRVMERFQATGPYADRRYELDGRNEVELMVETDRTVTPATDSRALGLRLEALEWSRLR